MLDIHDRMFRYILRRLEQLELAAETQNTRINYLEMQDKNKDLQSGRERINPNVIAGVRMCKKNNKIAYNCEEKACVLVILVLTCVLVFCLLRLLLVYILSS